MLGQLPLLGEAAVPGSPCNNPPSSRRGPPHHRQFASGTGSKTPRSSARRRPFEQRASVRCLASLFSDAVAAGADSGSTRRYHRCHGQFATELFVGRNNDASEQGVEADEAWQTSELRSLTPVFAGLAQGPRNGTDLARRCDARPTPVAWRGGGPRVSLQQPAIVAAWATASSAVCFRDRLENASLFSEAPSVRTTRFGALFGVALQRRRCCWR